MQETEQEDPMTFEVPGAASDVLYDLFCRIGVNSNGGEEHFHADFPNAGDETATYRNATFCVRRYDWSDRNGAFDPIADVNFEHYPTGLKLRFYKHLGRSTYANRGLSEAEMADIVRDCGASLPPDHRKGIARPHAVAAVTAVTPKVSAKGKPYRLVEAGATYMVFDDQIEIPAIGGEVAIARVKRLGRNAVIQQVYGADDLAEAKAVLAEPPASWSRLPEKDRLEGPGQPYDALAWREERSGRVIWTWKNVDPNLMR